MIKEIIFMGRSHVESKVKAFTPPAIIQEYYAGILIHDPGKNPPTYPTYVRPILRLEYHNDIINRRWNFTKLMAERVVNFLDHIQSSPQPFTLFIQSERGLHRSAAIARFVKAVFKHELKISGLATDRLDQADATTLAALTRQWSIKVAETYSGDTKSV